MLHIKHFSLNVFFIYIFKDDFTRDTALGSCKSSGRTNSTCADDSQFRRTAITFFHNNLFRIRIVTFPYEPLKSAVCDTRTILGTTPEPVLIIALQYDDSNA